MSVAGIRALHTLKGVGGDVLYCEEAAYMDLGVFYEVVVPIIEMETACLIMITTPLGSYNFNTVLTQLRDEDGNPVINSIQVGLICKRCMEESEHPENCTHRAGRRPDWKSEEKFRNIIKTMMHDQITRLRREAM